MNTKFTYKVNGKEVSTIVDGPLAVFDHIGVISDSVEFPPDWSQDRYKHVFVLFRAENVAGEPITGLIPYGKKRHFYVQQKVSFVVVDMGD